jgi:hypothetical protein
MDQRICPFCGGVDILTYRCPGCDSKCNTCGHKAPPEHFMTTKITIGNGTLPMTVVREGSGKLLLMSLELFEDLTSYQYLKAIERSDHSIVYKLLTIYLRRVRAYASNEEFPNCVLFRIVDGPFSR